ncbi:hypothetical protein B0H67DRAFT_500705 [Lasiosphaeris hirsuta]|uniref:Ankyrin n=1 Tax=Lasiosphaeris hirsuta TaxID=260670 RepID=A0AA39ZPI6_9PEZI|nr:hypothetical protein B0H67DRAFT_500705 [Lasiosphaeris hirsuta]
MDDLVVGYEDSAIKPNSFNGQTPLLWATEWGHETVVKLLLDRGAAIETKDEQQGQIPLSWATERGHKAVVKLLRIRGG